MPAESSKVSGDKKKKARGPDISQTPPDILQDVLEMNKRYPLISELKKGFTRDLTERIF